MKTHLMMGIVLVWTTVSLSGCASKTEEIDTQSGWSSKEESASAVMPARPEMKMGAHIDVVVEEQHLRAAAIEILTRAVDSTNPLLRANAIEGLKNASTPLASEMIRKGLGDENRAVRFTAAMITGELQLKEMRRLVEPLLLDTSESVQAAAMYAVKRCGGSPNISPLAGMLLGEDPEVKGNAALVLGELGDSSAISLLNYALGRGLLKSGTARRKIVELQIAEAMIKLGDLTQLEGVRAALFGRPEEGEIIALACQICGEVKDEGALPNLLDLATRGGRQQQSAEIRMAAAMAASQINPQRAVLSVPTAYMSNPRFELRAQAAMTLGASRQPAALPYLMELMQDANPLVQVAAASGVLQIQRGLSGPSGG
jgi:HEAT repeat protein